MQTEQSSHEAWARLIQKSGKAAMLMHFLVSRMDRSTNAVVASHRTLGRLMGSSTRSIKNWLTLLEKGRWIQVVSLGPGTSNAYVVNSMVAWSQARESLQYASFTAQVLALHEDQDQAALDVPDLRRIPALFPGEDQLPMGDGETPPSQSLLEGFEPDLPAIREEEQQMLPGFEGDQD